MLKRVLRDSMDHRSQGLARQTFDLSFDVKDHYDHGAKFVPRFPIILHGAVKRLRTSDQLWASICELILNVVLLCTAQQGLSFRLAFALAVFLLQSEERVLP